MTDRRVVLLGGWRTPFVRAGTHFAELDVLELAAHAVRETVMRSDLLPTDIDEVVFGNVSRPTKYHNVARELVLETGLPLSVPAMTVGLACASACAAITVGADKIAAGSADVLLAGGVESLSNVPLTLQPRFARALISASQARTLRQRVTSFAGVHLADIAPEAPAIRETSTGLTMGQSAEQMAAINGITRLEQDRWALRSHQLAAAGWADGRLAAEVAPLYRRGRAVSEDNHIRRDSSLEKMSELRPVYDRAHGTITAANASPLTDGAAAVILASEARARALGRTGLVALRSYAYAAVDPADQLLLAPAYAIPVALKRAGLAFSDIGLWEIHEAFAAQVLSTLRVMERASSYAIPEERVNVMGGSIALGHPFGATGARLAITLANEMRRRQVQFGVLSACAAGGNGAAIVLELLP